MRFRNSTHGPCFWGLELEITHCYFDFVNLTRPDKNVVVVPLSKLRDSCDYCSEIDNYFITRPDRNVVIIPLSKLKSSCDYCSQIDNYFNVPGANEYLVAGQKMALCNNGQLHWSLDHTHRRSLIAPTTEIGSKQLARALHRVADANGLRMCLNKQLLPYLCPCPD